MDYSDVIKRCGYMLRFTFAQKIITFCKLVTTAKDKAEAIWEI